MKFCQNHACARYELIVYAFTVVQVLQDVRHTQQNVTDAAAIPTMFKTKETAATVTWSGAFEIGDQMKISVKVLVRSHPTVKCCVCRSRTFASPSEQRTTGRSDSVHIGFARETKHQYM